METRKRNSKRNKRGMVLPLIISIALVLAILGMGMIRLGFGSRLMAIKSSAGITARAAADAGVTQALYEMNKLFNTIPGGPYTPSAVNQPLPDATNRNAIYSYHVEDPTIDPVTGENYWLITSTGTSGGEIRTVYARACIVNMFDYAIIVTDTITLNQNIVIDGYNSDFGYDPTAPSLYLRIGTNRNDPPPPEYPITLRNNVWVKGDVLVGVGGNPDELIWDQANPGATTGNRWTLPSTFQFDPIKVPLPDAPGMTINGDDITIVAPAGYTRDNPYTIETPYINIYRNPGPGTLTVVGHVELIVPGDMTLNSDTNLHVGDPLNPDTWGLNSSLSIYLNGNLEVKNGSAINNWSKIPNNFWLYGIGTGPSEQKWLIKQSGDFYGAYYGPNADIQVLESGQIFGSVSGKRFYMRENGKLHYDVQLSKWGKSDIGFEIYRWWEIVGPPTAPL